jgi:hypothetical protein
MRRVVLVLPLASLFVTTALARPIQTPTPQPPPQTATPTPTPPPPVTGTMTTGRSGMVGTVVVDRQTGTARIGGAPPEGVTIAKILQSGPTSWQNVKLDVKISDSITPDTQHGKTITVLCLDGNSSQVRSQSGEGLINIDARPMIRPDGRIYVQLILEYRPDLPNQPGAPANAPHPTGAFSESLNLLVADAKPMIASQTADPRSDRKVTIELTATVVK